MIQVRNPLPTYMAKPCATSHIGEVAKGIGIDKRISGDVKSKLVVLLSYELQRITSDMEEATISIDPERKTLGDPNRTRLGFNRTRGMMINNVKKLDSVGSAAVVSVNENLENYLLKLLLLASDNADQDKMNTIKPRHLDSALVSLNGDFEELGDNNDDILDKDNNLSKSDIDATFNGAILTTFNIKSMAKNLISMKIEEEALEDLLLVYYDHAAELQEDLQQNIHSGKFVEIELNFEKTKTFMMLGWLRRMLVKAEENAISSGSSKILINHVIRLDPWE